MIEETLRFDGTLSVPSRPDMEVELPGWLSRAIGPAALSAVRASDEDEDADDEDEDLGDEEDDEKDLEDLDDDDDDDLDDDDLDDEEDEDEGESV